MFPNFYGDSSFFSLCIQRDSDRYFQFHMRKHFLIGAAACASLDWTGCCIFAVIFVKFPGKVVIIEAPFCQIAEKLMLPGIVGP